MTETMPMVRKMTDHFRKFHEKDFIPWITQMSEHKVIPTGMAKNPIVRIKTSMMTATVPKTIFCLGISFI
jgi:hypothetical protein